MYSVRIINSAGTHGYSDAVQWRCGGPKFGRIWDSDGSGPRFVPNQDSRFVTNVVSVSNTSSIEILLL